MFVLYRDMRTYGLREDIYTEARPKGVQFIKYDLEKEIKVNPEESSIEVVSTDTSLSPNSRFIVTRRVA